MIKKRRNKIQILSLIGIMSILLTGCSANTNFSDVKGLRELGAAMNTRIENNIKMLNRYYNAGLIDDNTYANAYAHMNKGLEDTNVLIDATGTEPTSINAGTIASIVNNLTVGIEGVNDYVGTYNWTCEHEVNHVKVTKYHNLSVRIVRNAKWGECFVAYDIGGDDCNCARDPIGADDPIQVCIDAGGTNELGDPLGGVAPPSGAFLYLQNFLLSDMGHLSGDYKELKGYNTKNSMKGVTFNTKTRVSQGVITTGLNGAATNDVDNTKIGLGYKIIDQETAKNINKSMNLEIWVLDPSKLDGVSLDELSNKLALYKGIDLDNTTIVDASGSSNGNSVEDVVEDEANTDTESGSDTTAQLVSGNSITKNDLDSSSDILEYFSPARDIDTDSPVYMYLQELSANEWSNLGADDYKEWADAPVHSSSVNAFNNYRTGTITDLGHDLVVRCGKDTDGAGWDNIVMRLYEFSYDNYKKLSSKGLITDNTFLRMTVDNNSSTSNSKEEALLLLSYPISILKNMKETSDGSNVYFETAKSQLNVNLMTGKVTKTEKYTGGEAANVVDKDSPYTIIAKKGSTQNTVELSTSSYAVYGKMKMKLGKDSDKMGYVGTDFIAGTGDRHGKAEFYTSKIVLRDYLEATYMPDLVGSDPLVVYGRKIRFTQFPTKNKPVAKSVSLANFVDIDGNTLSDGTDLYCDDFADIKKLTKNNPEVKYIKYKEDKDRNAASNTGMISEQLSEALSQVGKLKYTSVSGIQLTGTNYTFPGKYIDPADKGENRLPVMHVMALTKDVAQSGLMSWLTNKNENAGFNWWTKWLKNQQYSYILAGNTIDALFQGAYTYELEPDGYVVLDLDTVSQIEKEFSKQDDEQRISTLQTAFVIMGWVIVMFACLLPFLWLIDTSYDFGLNIIEKISFGHWVPVKYSSDIPEMDTEEREYIDFWAILKKSVILIILGVVLIRVNIIGLIARLAEAFGGIGEYISNKILGI